MFVAVAIMTAPVAMLLNTVYQNCPLTVVDMTMGSMASAVFGFDLVT